MNFELKRFARLLIRIEKTTRGIERTKESIKELRDNGSSPIFSIIHKKNLIALMKKRDRIMWAKEEWEFNNVKSDNDLGNVLMICRGIRLLKYYFELKKRINQ